MDEAQLLLLANAYKEQIREKLLILVPDRLAQLDPGVFEGRTSEEVFALIYMQSVTETLDAFDMTKLLATN